MNLRPYFDGNSFHPLAQKNGEKKNKDNYQHHILHCCVSGSIHLGHF